MPFTLLANTTQVALGWKLKLEERRILLFFICHLPFPIFHFEGKLGTFWILGHKGKNGYSYTCLRSESDQWKMGNGKWEIKDIASSSDYFSIFMKKSDSDKK
jgi:hypothetical protein